MKVTLLALMIVVFSCESSKIIHCTIQTEFGNIELELYESKAPLTVANFMFYVDAGHYKNSHFYRVTTRENEAKRDYPIEVIQGGDVPNEAYQSPIEIETTEQTGVLHLDGAISMARGKPNTATSHFFICINDQPELDFGGKRNPDGFGFAAFGKVIKGMDIVKKIQSMNEERQYLVEKVKIVNIIRK